MYRMNDFDDFEDFENLVPARKNGRKSHRRKQMVNPQHTPKKQLGEMFIELADSDEDSGDFIRTYNASRHERIWIIESLSHFYHQRWITDILRQIKGGKEASVYLCEGDQSAPYPLMAAKVYRPRIFRNLRNDHLYREGRPELDEAGNQIIDGGMLHAMAKHTTYGRDVLHSSWIAYEMVSMERLYAAGANIPRPLGRSNNAILMEYIGAPQFPAPILQTISLEPEEARQLFYTVVDNIALMLSLNIVHGDLSAYNILYWEGEIKIIDFPQVISPEQNRNAWQIFSRDVQRICEYFQSQGIDSDHKILARNLWKSYGRRTRPDVHPGLLDAEDDADYAYWQEMQSE